MPKVDVTVEPVSVEIEVPDECTVGQWKRMLGDGWLGDKILYSNRLQCYLVDRGGALGDEEHIPTLPQRIFMKGPNSVLKMLELALNKQSGRRSSKPIPKAPPERGYMPKAAPPPAASPVRPAPADPVPPVAKAPVVASSPSPLWPKDQNSRLSVYSAGYQGMRPYMEDRACGLLAIPGYPEASVFGVFDGHGGYQVAQMAAERLPRVLVEKLKAGAEPGEAMKDAFCSFDDDLRQNSSTSFQKMGSTAIMTLLLEAAGGYHLYCANCGDSRAVLCRNDAAVALSQDQKPNNPEERQRIEAAGGKVGLSGPCYRIDSGLNLSRALGDFLYKANRELPAEQQKVICLPEILEVQINSEDQFFVMASDGVFEVFSSDQLIEELLKERRRLKTWPMAVDSILKRAWSSGDNVSICLVEFLQADVVA